MAVIDGLDRALAGSGQPGLVELRAVLADQLLAMGPAKLVAEERLKPRVFRLRFEVGDRARSFVVKRMEPAEALRNELATRRWLPAQGLDGVTPAIAGIAAERGGHWVWHAYENLDAQALETDRPDPGRVAAVVRVVAMLHSRFAEHPWLAECRQHGKDLGIAYFSSNVRDAIHALDALRPPHVSPSGEQAALRDRLLGRLRCLRDELPLRARALEEWGGPETFLHGDLWTTNTFVEPAPDGLRARLIDWDHAGVGPASYDVSTFLLRFDPADRPWILDLYRQAAGHGWSRSGVRELNLLFETAELARYANRVIWPAIALRREQVTWGFPALADIESWFEALRPVVPVDPPQDAPMAPEQG